MKNAIFAIILLLSASTAIAQSHGYMLPSYPERFGKGIRKIVEIQDDGTRRTTKLSRDGRYVEPVRQVYAPTKRDSAFTRRNRETLTDSTFRIRGGETELVDVTWYSDTGFSDRVKYISCRKGALMQTTFKISKADTTIWLTVDDTDRFKPKPFFRIYKKYPGGEVDMDYSPDSLLISSFRVVYDSRGEVDTIYNWRRYGAPRGCMGRRDTSEWLQIETHKYEYNRRGGIVEERVYFNDTLGFTMRYKLKYYPGSPKHPANNEEFYYHTVKNKFITCNGGYIADYGMLPRKARRFVASSGYDRSEVSKVVCTSNEYHIRPWPKEDRKVSRSHWWVVLADSTCICFDRRGRFQMVEHYYDGLDARWISMIPDKALSHIKQECGANEKYHIIRISVSARGWRVYYWIETPGLIKSGLPPSYLYDRNWNVISQCYPI